MKQDKKVVVTGGAGFIGSHLTGSLVRRGYNVKVLDDLSTGKLRNIEGLISENDIDFIRGSVTNLSLLQKLFRDVSCVFHLAAIPSVPRSIDEPLPCHQVNASGTLKVLLAARDNRVNKVIYSSSSSVYGDTPVLPKKENMLPDPQSPYAVAKLAGEYYCRVFHKVYGLATVCLRYFNVFGPGQDPDSQYAAVIPRFIKGCFEGNSPTIFGDGEQTRDFTFVKDVVSANLLAEESNASGVFNISRGDSITINRLAEYIIELTGSNVEPVYQRARPGDIKHSSADISKAEAFGYKPLYDLETGLAETIKWFKGV
ncbi:MAG: SDR family oxidoreductase [Chloroflexi bacterium]|nr:SDR family oxidoreductase [Chloroflexota bacterium]